MLRRFESSLKHPPREWREGGRRLHISCLLLPLLLFFSPRRRSKTPERGEKFKRNVHFQDEEKYDENNARESSNSDERNRQDTREIVHPDGKVMFNWQNRSNWNLLLLPNGMLVHGSNLSPVWNISLAVGNMALEPKLPIQPELIPVSTLWSDNEIFYFP